MGISFSFVELTCSESDLDEERLFSSLWPSFFERLIHRRRNMAQSLFLQSFLLALALFPSFSVAYSWHFSAPPTQCSNLSIAVTGSGGIPPYRVLIVPFGPSTLSSHTEVRSIIDQPFDGSSTTVEFPINYPANSHFIAVVRSCAHCPLVLTEFTSGQRCLRFRHRWDKCGNFSRRIKRCQLLRFQKANFPVIPFLYLSRRDLSVPTKQALVEQL